MNPVNLLLPDGTASRVWMCGRCDYLTHDQHLAAICCGPILCPICGLPTEQNYRPRWPFAFAPHGTCDRERHDNEIREQIARATPVETWDSWVLDPYGYGPQDGYFENLAELIAWYCSSAEDRPTTRPDQVFVCEPTGFPALYLDEILDDLALNLNFDDARSSILGTKDLGDAISRFNEANSAVTSYEADHSRVVRVPWDDSGEVARA